MHAACLLPLIFAAHYQRSYLHSPRCACAACAASLSRCTVAAAASFICAVRDLLRCCPLPDDLYAACFFTYGVVHNARLRLGHSGLRTRGTTLPRLFLLSPRCGRTRRIGTDGLRRFLLPDRRVDGFMVAYARKPRARRIWTGGRHNATLAPFPLYAPLPAASLPLPLLACDLLCISTISRIFTTRDTTCSAVPRVLARLCVLSYLCRLLAPVPAPSPSTRLPHAVRSFCALPLRDNHATHYRVYCNTSPRWVGSRYHGLSGKGGTLPTYSWAYLLLSTSKHFLCMPSISPVRL